MRKLIVVLLCLIGCGDETSQQLYQCDIQFKACMDSEEGDEVFCNSDYDICTQSADSTSSTSIGNN